MTSSSQLYEPITEEQRVAEWTSAAINLLIEKFRTYKLQLEKKNSIKKHIWKKIANEMQEFEYTYTWDQLQNKWKSMLRTYKSIKDHNNQSGRNRKNWDYFNKMDELLYGHPAIDPPILIHNGIQIKKIDDESTSKSETVSTPESSRARNIELLKEAEILVADVDWAGPYIYNLPNLKWLQGTWAGVDAISPYIDKPLPFLFTRYSGHRFGQMMSEYVVSHIVFLERDFRAMERNQLKRSWIKDGKILEYRVLSSLTIGVLGFGNIGSWVGKSLHMFGAEILAYGRSSQLQSSAEFVKPESYYTKATLPEFLKKCDYIVSTLPSTPETIGLLNGEVLKNCEEKKPVFINVGRGTIIKEADLVNAIKNKWISRAILDVFEVEPLPENSPLWTMEEVIITPHVAAESQPKHIAEQFNNHLSLYLAKKPIPSTFIYEKGY
ncbi:hypothetical protein FQR65_LT13890 [Abscondita terminalis]|nr:hypothetical protein FQR65_LT13890 [Abscondita terminalis]